MSTNLASLFPKENPKKVPLPLLVSTKQNLWGFFFQKLPQMILLLPMS